jgi:hypothetical protein
MKGWNYMFDRHSPIASNAIDTQTILNWVLIGLGIAVFLFLLLYLWRYIRQSNQAGRISDFDERTFKKLVGEERSKEQIPVCKKCKTPMRVEIRYKDFLKDTGDFLFHQESVEQTTTSLVACDRISKKDKEAILLFFKEHPEIEQQLFKRYKCPNCHSVQILPYIVQQKSNDK